MSHMNITYNHSVLDNGTRLVTEQVPGAASVAFGLWADAGSRDELVSENGLAHLIEHMVFKGTERRDKTVIAREMDRQGGLANAYTTKEYTCFHTRVRAEDLPAAVDLMVDIFQKSLYDVAELELEKGVIQQEIAMYEDEPEELVHDLASAAVWPGLALGRPVAGTAASVAALDRPAILDWLARHYTGPRLVISAAGAVDHGQLADLLAAAGLRSRPEAAPRTLNAAPIRPGNTVRRRKLEQVHLVLTSDFPHLTDPRRHAASVLNAALGGNLSSRLFQEIRERRGLAYSVYSSYTPYLDAGTMEIYAAAAPDQAAETHRLIRAELVRLAAEPLTPDELAEAALALKTGLVLGGESMDSRMSRLGKNELIHGRSIDLEETCRNLDLVRAEDIQALAAEFWAEGRLAACALGPVKSFFFAE